MDFVKITNPDIEHICGFQCYVAKHSVALIISDGERSKVLEHHGGHLDYWLNEAGITDEFDGVEPGVWVWEGYINSHRDYWGEYEEELVGDFRKLTVEEWDLLRDDDDLWDDEEWDSCPEHSEAGLTPENAKTKGTP